MARTKKSQSKTAAPAPDEVEDSAFASELSGGDVSDDSDQSDDDLDDDLDPELEADLDADLDEEIDDDLAGDDDFVGDASSEDGQVDLAEAEPEDDDEEIVPLLLTKDEEFEEFDEDEDEDDVEVEGLREGEFVCSDCSMVYRLTALADPKAMLCRDCV